MNLDFSTVEARTAAMTAIENHLRGEGGKIGSYVKVGDNFVRATILDGALAFRTSEHHESHQEGTAPHLSWRIHTTCRLEIVPEAGQPTKSRNARAQRPAPRSRKPAARTAH